jgi:hypothetical protein
MSRCFIAHFFAVFLCSKLSIFIAYNGRAATAHPGCDKDEQQMLAVHTQQTHANQIWPPQTCLGYHSWWSWYVLGYLVITSVNNRCSPLDEMGFSFCRDLGSYLSPEGAPVHAHASASSDQSEHNFVVRNSPPKHCKVGWCGFGMYGSSLLFALLHYTTTSTTTNTTTTTPPTTTLTTTPYKHMVLQLTKLCFRQFSFN